MNDEEHESLEQNSITHVHYSQKLDASSNCMMLLSAVCAYDHVPKEEQNGFYKHYLRHKMMEEIQKLKNKLEI